MTAKLPCKYAWSHLDFLQGQYAPCFRFKVNLHPIANIDDKLPSEVINSSEMQEVRHELLNGKFPTGCFDCQYKESLGLNSYRKDSLNNASWGHYIDYDAVTTKILDLELKFSRACNFLCRHCDATSNSSFETLGEKNKEIRSALVNEGFKHLTKSRSPIKPIPKKVIDDLIKNVIPTVERISFSGGEPLYHKEHYEFLKKLINDTNIDTKRIKLIYNTNLSMIKFKNYNVKDLWKEFNSVSITVSMDGTGDLFNYFRVNGDYETTVKNIFSILEDNINVSNILLVCTCSSYHAFYADVIFKDLCKLRQEIIAKNPELSVNIKPTFVHTTTIDMVNLEDDAKDFIVKNLTNTLSEDPLYNKCVSQIITYLQGERRNSSVDFRKILKLQDTLHNMNPEEKLQRLWNYAYNNNLCWD